jgi:hypothetical protein
VAIGPWQSSGIVYPGGAPTGPCGIVGGLLGYLTTYPLVATGLVEIQLCVSSSIAGVAPCCVTIFFELERNLVWIRGLEGLSVPPAGLFDCNAQIVDGSGVVRSFGTAVRVFGSADVGGCTGQTIKRYTLRYQPGFTCLLTGAWTQFWEVDYVTPFQVDAGTNLVFENALTRQWFEEEFFHVVPFPLPPHLVCAVVGEALNETYWSTQVPSGPYPVNYPDLNCGEAPAATWNSTPLALTNCQSGRYTLRLTVEDTGGGITDVLRQVWFDNKNIYGKIAQIGSIPACSTIGLSFFSGGVADCSKPWPAPLLGLPTTNTSKKAISAHPAITLAGIRLKSPKTAGVGTACRFPAPAVRHGGHPSLGPPG